MSYSLADATGVLEEFASVGGLSDFRDWARHQSATIRQFVTLGYTEDISRLHEELLNAVPTKLIADPLLALISAAERAKGVLILTDGTSDLENIRTAGGQQETALHKTADEKAAKLEVILRYAFAVARRKLKGGRQNIEPALNLMRAALEAGLPKVLREIFNAGGQTAAEMLHRKLRTAEFRTAKKTERSRIDFDFDHENQAAIDWADRHAAELITQITETSRERINNAVAEFLETGDWNEHLSEILEAVGDVDRARLIARNEPMIAVSEGQREAWGQAVEAGLLDGDEEREWIVVGDDKVCPICDGLEGKRAKLGQSYISDEGVAYDGPPAHVSCRCTEGIV